MRKISKLPKHLRSIVKRCPSCHKKGFRLNQITKKEWKCEKCGFTNKPKIEFSPEFMRPIKAYDKFLRNSKSAE